MSARANEAQAKSGWANVATGIITAVVAFAAAFFAAQAAKAARDNLVHDKRTARAQLRPWISYTHFNMNRFQQGIVNDKPVPHGFVASISFINTGLSPALNLRLFGDYRVGSMDENEEAPRFERQADDNDPIRPGSMGPQRSAHSAECAFGPPEADNFESHRASIWLYARADYEEPGHEGESYVTEVTLRIFYGGEQVAPNGERSPRYSAVVSGPQNTMS
ncbi:MAG TPA: hypothetical protein VFI67_09610 [Sphingomicrobium sp.]|nr:hypothetical protein [Sphingomicrobium sp.]